MLAIRIIKQVGQHFSKHNLKPHESAMDPLSVYYITEIRMTQKAMGKSCIFYEFLFTLLQFESMQQINIYGQFLLFLCPDKICKE